MGYGDRDIDLHRCNPLLLTALLRAIEPAGVPVMLLHNYPYHREANYLAQVFPHIYMDAGLATHNLGHRATALIAECLELVPFGKFLYSSDGFGLPKLHYLGAVLFARAVQFPAGLPSDGAWTEADAARIARLTGYENALRVYSPPRVPAHRGSAVSGSAVRWSCYRADHRGADGYPEICVRGWSGGRNDPGLRAGGRRGRGELSLRAWAPVFLLHGADPGAPDLRAAAR